MSSNIINSSNSNNDRFQVVSDAFRDDSFSTKEDVRGVGKARPNLEAMDYSPKTFRPSVEKS